MSKIFKITAAVVLLNVFCRGDSLWCPDLHTDDFVNLVDFAALADNWNKSGSGLIGDIDGNGTVNIYDIEILSSSWLKSTECKSADFNRDYTINFIDMAKIAGVWLEDANSVNWDTKYDLDNSESIDLDDLSIICRRWLKNYPEPNDTFVSFKNALVSGNIETAVSFFADSVSDDYAVVLTELQAVLPEMAGGMGNLELIYSDDNIAQYEMVHDEGGGVISSFPVYFTKDPNGVWKIYCF